MNEKKGLFAISFKKLIPALILIFVLLLLSLSACGAEQKPAEADAVAPAAETAPVDANVETVEETPVPEPELWDGSFETPVGTLHFSAELAPDVELEDISAGGQFALAFSVQVAEEKVELFKLLIGGAADAYCLGSAPNADNTMLPVFVDIRQIQPGENWTEEEIERVNLLQSSVNEIIDQIYDLPGFDPELIA